MKKKPLSKVSPVQYSLGHNNAKQSKKTERREPTRFPLHHSPAWQWTFSASSSAFYFPGSKSAVTYILTAESTSSVWSRILLEILLPSC